MSLEEIRILCFPLCFDGHGIVAFRNGRTNYLLFQAQSENFENRCEKIPRVSETFPRDSGM
jgi:hypothetical protein